MKLQIITAVIMLAGCITCHAQDRLQKALNMYDYKEAVHIVDSLMAQEGADSISLALQKAR
ncbi:MAG: hypothetical protein E7113_05380, partial [Bacteroidales bacterium]|nr:hypothetical protein [Bacteroidales bacterium]